jgi:hypothetical protein
MHEMRHQVGMGDQVLRCSALAQRGCLRAPHDSGVQLLHPCIQVFLISSGGRVQEGPGQQCAQRRVIMYSGVLDQLRGDA